MLTTSIMRTYNIRLEIWVLKWEVWFPAELLFRKPRERFNRQHAMRCPKTKRSVQNVTNESFLNFYLKIHDHYQWRIQEGAMGGFRDGTPSPMVCAKLVKHSLYKKLIQIRYRILKVIYSVIPYPKIILKLTSLNTQLYSTSNICSESSNIIIA